MKISIFIDNLKENFNKHNKTKKAKSLKKNTPKAKKVYPFWLFNKKKNTTQVKKED